LSERGEASLPHGIVFVARQEHADAPDAVALLRPRRKRPRRRAAERSDEFAPFKANAHLTLRAGKPGGGLPDRLLHDASGCRRQCEDALVAIASADDLGIDDVEAALNQPLHDCPGNTFIREERRHALLTRL
jgi:hypothetical protein